MRLLEEADLLASLAPFCLTHYGQWIPSFRLQGPHYSDPTLRSAMRVTPSGFHTIYKGFLQLRHRVVITRVSCLRRGLLAALPENLLFTKDSCKFVRGRSLLASGVASSAITQVLRSLFGVFGSLTRDPFDHSAFSEATSFVRHGL